MVEYLGFERELYGAPSPKRTPHSPPQAEI